MDAIIRIAIGVLLIVCGLGWTILVGLAAAMADSDPNPGSTNRAALVGLGVATLGVADLCLPLLFH